MCSHKAKDSFKLIRKGCFFDTDLHALENKFGAIDSGGNNLMHTECGVTELNRDTGPGHRGSTTL